MRRHSFRIAKIVVIIKRAVEHNTYIKLGHEQKLACSNTIAYFKLYRTYKVVNTVPCVCWIV